MSRMTEQIGRVLGGRYRLLSPLGSGASAQVYLAEDVRLRRRVAVKVLHPALADDESFLRRFRAEAQAAAALSHPHVLAVFDWSDEDTPYLVTEYLAGGSLRAMLDAGHRLSPAQALVVGLEAARALDYAHRQGFVHRDIKPANLLFGRDGRLRVADFGLARAVAEAGWTETGTVLGTVRYASPEQARGEKVDGRSDVYSLALVLVEAVTGEVPFTADTPVGTLMARLERPLEVPDEMGPLAPVLRRAGEVDRAARIDAAELGRGLVEAAKELTRPAPLPLVGAGAPEDDPVDGRDATLVAPMAQPPGAAAPPRPPVGHAPTGPAGPPAPPGPVTVAPRELSHHDRSVRRLMLAAVAVVVATVAGVILGWSYLRSNVPTHEVPDLVGMDIADAEARVRDLDWELDRREEHRDGTEEGEVLATRPAAGEPLREGETLVVVVSLGPSLVEVPDYLIGMTEEEARAELEAVGLEADFVPQPSRSFDEGVVTGYVDEDVPDELPRGEVVSLYVSSGDEVEMPDLEGLPYADAVTQLEELGLEVRLESERDDDVEPGHVVRTEPEAGDEVELGDRVTVVVAVDVVEVPRLGGRDLDEATERLEDAGLEVGNVFGPRDGKVLASWPLEGSEVAVGSSVDLVMRP
ncbi:MAG TPA: PASTA domain-containing protein [Acidimicrobiales bacterium]|nr:PASTA domain-containing protein [Acidimicrobiales bacterium]